MKPTICLKIFSFSVDDLISAVFNFICGKIIFELSLRAKLKWISKQKSNVGVTLKCVSVSYKSVSCEPMSLIVAYLRIAS